MDLPGSSSWFKGLSMSGSNPHFPPFQVGLQLPVLTFHDTRGELHILNFKKNLFKIREQDSPEKRNIYIMPARLLKYRKFSCPSPEVTCNQQVHIAQED